jgi:hypothetical protein
VGLSVDKWERRAARVEYLTKRVDESINQYWRDRAMTKAEVLLGCDVNQLQRSAIVGNLMYPSRIADALADSYREGCVDGARFENDRRSAQRKGKR